MLTAKLLVAAALSLLNGLTSAADQEPVIGDLFKFHSDPEIVSPKPTINYTVSDRSLLHPGYFFLTPGGAFDGQKWYSFGAHIYDNEGNLVYNGRGQANVWDAPDGPMSMKTLNARVCDLWGVTGKHICLSNVPQRAVMFTDHNMPTNRIFNSSYEQVVGDFPSINPDYRPDPHDFHTVAGGQSLVQLVDAFKRVDLSGFEGSRDGYILDGCFEDVDVWERTASLTWCVADAVSLDDTKVYMWIPANMERFLNQTSGVAGNGSLADPWDYVHLNSVDVTSEGDYIVSLRHFDQIIKLAGRKNPHGMSPGTIMWRLGGKNSSITLGSEVAFSRQHDPTSLRVGHMDEDILVFDNAWDNNALPTAPYSSAKVIRVSNHTGTATVLHEYQQPQNLTAEAEGSAQRLSNGNIVVGWGTIPHTSEFSENGTLLLNMEMSPPIKAGLGFHAYGRSYRSYKFDWVGVPRWPPKVFAYRRDCDSPTFVYASWNGATEVRSWRFSISLDAGQTWSGVRTVGRTGFETIARLSGRDSMAQWVSAEALDKHGNALSERVPSEVWLPTTAPQIARAQSLCDTEGCVNHSTPFASFWYPESLRSTVRCAGYMPSTATSSSSLKPLVWAFGLVGGLVACWLVTKKYMDGAMRDFLNRHWMLRSPFEPSYRRLQQHDVTDKL